jgi:5-oxoprolinase (ATP-hydrolysing) subunit A
MGVQLIVVKGGVPDERDRVIDLNADLGEGFPYDDDILSLVTSVNVCCGGYAGSTENALALIQRCRRRGIRVGLHFGYPDPDNFGRTSPSPKQTEAWLDRAIESALMVHLESPADYVKPHGALYNDLAKGSLVNANLFSAEDRICAFLEAFRLPLMGMAGTRHEHIARQAGVELIREAFPERGYTSDGLLLPRSQPGAILNDLSQIVQQAERLTPESHSLCFHGDESAVLIRLHAVRLRLNTLGVQIKAV